MQNLAFFSWFSFYFETVLHEGCTTNYHVISFLLETMQASFAVSAALWQTGAVVQLFFDFF